MVGETNFRLWDINTISTCSIALVGMLVPQVEVQSVYRIVWFPLRSAFFMKLTLVESSYIDIFIKLISFFKCGPGKTHAHSYRVAQWYVIGVKLKIWKVSMSGTIPLKKVWEVTVITKCFRIILNTII